jgi:SAM-dependent methyltransferase
LNGGRGYLDRTGNVEDRDVVSVDRRFGVDPISCQQASFLFNGMKRASGALWSASLGDAIEVGCGTGGFTMVVLSQIPACSVILTDTSLKMFGLCRAKLSNMNDLHATALTFATFSGTETCFRADAFDTCFGTSVLQHIVDVPSILQQFHRFLTPGGRAFFLEPNLRFHSALTATLARILAQWALEKSLPPDDASPMINWMAEVHCKVVNSGEIDILKDREDKLLLA